MPAQTRQVAATDNRRSGCDTDPRGPAICCGSSSSRFLFEIAAARLPSACFGIGLGQAAPLDVDRLLPAPLHPSNGECPLEQTRTRMQMRAQLRSVCLSEN